MNIIFNELRQQRVVIQRAIHALMHVLGRPLKLTKKL